LAERRKKKFSWHEFRVGLFVIGSFAILLFLIFRVSGGRGFFTMRSTAVSYLPTIEGLKPGAPVWLNGIEIGNVEEITLDEKLPPTRANLETKEKINSIQADISLYENMVTESQDRITDFDTRIKTAGPQLKDRLKKNLNDEQERLTSLNRSLENFKRDLKLSKDNLQNIKVILKIETQYEDWIRKDSEVSIGSIGLLGDKYVEISIGRSEERPVKTPEGHLFIEGVNEATIRQLMVGANDLMANFGDITESVKSITTKLDAGDGTIGQLINNTVLHDALTATVQSLEGTVDQAGLVLRDIREREGTLGKLIYNKELYEELTGTITELKKFMGKLNESEGTLDKLIRDPELYNNLKDITAKIDHIVERIDKGEGTIEQIDEGKGTLGMLLKDKQLYNNLNEALAEMVKLVYDLRKNPKKYLKIKFSIF